MVYRFILSSSRGEICLRGKRAECWGFVPVETAAIWCLVAAVAAVSAGCKPKLNSADPSERIRAVQNLTDEAVLANVANVDEAWEVRRAAVEKLTNQSVLAKIAVEDTDDSVRRTAAGKLTDQAILAKVAAQAEARGVSVAGVGQLNDQAVLAKVAIEDSDAGVRYTAVVKLVDQAVLGKVALEEQNANVRDAAFEKLSDQAVLAEIAAKDEGNYSCAAVTKMTDRALLAKVAIEAEDPNARGAAYDRIVGSGSLTQLCASTIPTTRRYASLLLKIASICQPIPMQHRDRLRLEVLGIIHLLTDPVVAAELGDVQTIYTEWEARREYYHQESGPPAEEVPPIDGETFLVAVNLSNAYSTISHRWTTKFPDVAGIDARWLPARIDELDFPRDICRLCSVPMLTRIATGSERQLLRRAAVENLTDQAVLAKVATKDNDWQVRRAAVAKLNDRLLLAKILSEDKVFAVSQAANERLAGLPR
jgi:hypothetical protein